MVNSTPWPLYPRERDRVPIVHEAGWTPGPVWTRAENLIPTEFRSPDRPARSESLCRLRRLGPRKQNLIEMNMRGEAVLVSSTEDYGCLLCRVC